jgi:nucleotide-binding universal stress UspA family protein
MTVDTVFTETERLKADMLVLGAHERGGLFKALLGNVSEAVLKRAKLPTLIVPLEERG